ncbi:MAG: substrate-binding domain-containing protein, partial [Actinomycetota bacterium]
MNINNPARLLGALTLSAVILAGCVRDTATSGGANAPVPANPPADASKKLTLALVPKGTTHQFWQTVKAGAEAAGKDLNAEILFNGPSKENNVPEQIDIVRNYAAQGVDGIAVAATDKGALVKPVEELQ